MTTRLLAAAVVGLVGGLATAAIFERRERNQEMQAQLNAALRRSRLRAVS